MAYATEAGMKNVYGTTAINEWANIDGDGTTSTARKTYALAAADAEIDDMAAEAGYDIPLQTSAGATPTSIAHLADALAGLLLYEATGARDVDARTGTPVHPFAWKRQWVYDVLGQIRTKQRRLNARPHERS